MARIQGQRAWTEALPSLAAAIGVVLLCRFLPRLTTSLVVALLLALIIDPIVTQINRRTSLAANKCIILAYVMLTLVILCALLLIIPVLAINIAELLSDYDNITRRIADLFGGLYERLGVDTLLAAFYARITAIFEHLGTVYLEAAGVIATIFVAFIISYYLIREKRTIINGVLSLFPLSWRDNLTKFGVRCSHIWTKYIGGQLAIASIIGIIETSGLLILRLPQAPLLGFIGGLSNLIPYVGPFIGAIPSVVQALITTGSGKTALAVILIFVGVQQFDNYFLTPRIVRGALGLHPAVTIAAVLAGIELGGFFGAVTAVPIAALFVPSSGRLTTVNLVEKGRK